MLSAADIDRALTRIAHEIAPAGANQPVEKVRNDIERDKILSAQAALEYGLVDQVLESRKKPQLPAR